MIPFSSVPTSPPTELSNHPQRTEGSTAHPRIAVLEPQLEGANMATKVAKAGIQREKGWLYYLDKKGDISRARMARGRGHQPKATPEQVAKLGVEREEGYLYFIDKEGDVSRTKMARRGRRAATGRRKAASRRKTTARKAVSKTGARRKVRAKASSGRKTAKVVRKKSPAIRRKAVRKSKVTRKRGGRGR